MKINRILRAAVIAVMCLAVVLMLKCITKKYILNQPKVGEKIDSFNNIPVYYNGSTATNLGRNRSAEGYNYGLKYQCVEFVKRYYYDHLNHKMSNTFCHAKDFYNPNLKDNERNSDRNLLQFSNPSNTKPKINDILIFDANSFNAYGHVAIVSKVTDDEIEIIQQNPGRFGNSRETIDLIKVNNKWKLDNASILGWLRKN
ncbi:CHAP domain-containing protein [Flavobacterium haoranii]|uniref:CHAP domain-containing protein n=2 Tax=Flavobacterium haoranii TaxID=683124 RepID=A0A1M6C4N0_9FLAO|nr:CHAP domain-containing protein [Flavobacterium haoranii]SHI55979.1 CHAP domain-containing protein [Flavobacterium haoranii]